MRRGILAITLLACFFYGLGQSKVEHVDNLKVTRTKAVFLGKTEPVGDLVKRHPTSREKKSAFKINKIVPNFIGRGTSKVVKPELEHQGPDPIRQSKIPSGVRSTSVVPRINMDGLFDSSFSPDDPSGDVGVDYYVHAINATTIAVYDKTDGTEVATFTGNDLWNPLGEASAGDPIVLFDHEVSRWVITEFTSPQGTENLLFAISDTSDPLGSYVVYSFSPPSFPDYPKWAIWNNTYMVTTNEEGPADLHQYFLDRSAILIGSQDVTLQRVEIAGNVNTEAGFYVSTPVHWIGDTAPEDNNPIAVKINDSSWGEVTEDAIELFTFDVDFENGTTVTKTTIVTTPFDSYPCDNESNGFACVSQGSSASGVDAIPEVIMNLPHYRNFGTHETIVLSFITDVTDGDNVSGIRWVELRRTTGDWELYQEGTYAPDDGLHRFMPSISIDQNGNIGLGYNVSSSTEDIGIRFTGRFAEDELGLMTVLEANAVSGTGAVVGDRFGDYAHMSVDPIDEMTFWYTSEYGADVAGGTKTRIVSFQLELNDDNLGVVSIDAPETGALTSEETVTATVQNFGKNSVSTFDISLYLDDFEVETFNYSGDLIDSYESYEHTFSTPIDLSDLGEYEIEVSVSLTDDEVPENDSLVKIIKKLAEIDASVTMIAPSRTCDSELEAEIEIVNEGTEILSSLDIELYVNDEFLETINWTGSLSFLESTTELVVFSDFIDGDNTISVKIVNPNGSADQLPDDNEFSVNVNVLLVSEILTLTLLTDEYPEETTWKLESDGITYASGGPYNLELTEFVEEICVDPNLCYTFTINDSFGDGICCGEGEGEYELEDSFGKVIISGGEFGESESKDFCAGECYLSVSVDEVDVIGDVLGSIVFDASGSDGYSYSIDGGDTFSTSPTFDQLEAGVYEVVVATSQGGDCIYEESIEIEVVCELAFKVDTEEVDLNVGTIIITPIGGLNYLYSIDGGVNFSEDSIFTDIDFGTYEIFVTSNNDECTVSETFIFDTALGVRTLSNTVEVYPNPTEGVFKLKVYGHEYIQGFLEIEVLDINGKAIQYARFSRYDEAFEGTISLYAYPDGVYFIRLSNAESGRVVKVLKQ